MNKDELKDLIKHTKTFYDVVRVYNQDKATNFQAKDAEQTLFMSGKFKTYFSDLDDGSVGINRMPTLNGMLNFAAYNEPTSKYDLVTELKGEQKQLSEIAFTSPQGHKSTYRFMGSKVVDNQVKVPPFKGASWDVSFRPTTKMISDLSHFSTILGGNDCVFTAKVIKGKLEFHIGSQGQDRAVVPICDTTGTMKKEWSWPLYKFISILKLADGEVCTVNISSQAAMKIEIESDKCFYDFIMPAMR